SATISLEDCPTYEREVGGEGPSGMAQSVCEARVSSETICPPHPANARRAESGAKSAITGVGWRQATRHHSSRPVAVSQRRAEPRSLQSPEFDLPVLSAKGQGIADEHVGPVAAPGKAVDLLSGRRVEDDQVGMLHPDEEMIRRDHPTQGRGADRSAACGVNDG